MNKKWIQITENYVLNSNAIVTRTLKKVNLHDVTIGNAGWGLHNGAIAYMELPQSIQVSPNIWKSEYRGDELPEGRNRWCIVQLQGIAQHNYEIHRISNGFFQVDKAKWSAIPDGWEVIAWMDFPKPYKGAK